MVQVRPILYQAVITLSSCLVFLVQPIIAKQIVPWFGGSASVWTTCIFFFQLVLLGGYAYAHALTRWASPAWQARIHVAALLVSLASLPVVASQGWKFGDGPPALRILFLLLVTVGLPYGLLASTSPLVQAWYARIFDQPYRLFALSNTASLAGLLAYPFLFEPTLTTTWQAWGWSALYVVYVAVSCLLAIRTSRSAPVAGRARTPAGSAGDIPVTRADAITWMVLAALASLALISVTAFVTANVAAIPLIWVVPLAIYLLTFIVAFGPVRVPTWPVAVVALVLGIAMIHLSRSDEVIYNFALSFPLYMGGLFFLCLLCHGEIAATRPSSAHLTLFYLLVSLGGAVGSLLGSIVAPVVLSGNFEFPLTIAAIAIAFAWTVRRQPILPRLVAGLLAVAAVAVGALQIASQVESARVLRRNFYTSLRVVDVTQGPEAPFRRLEHGRTVHGTQFTTAAKRGIPASFYGEDSGLGLALRRAREVAGGPLRIGVIGLGTGTVATYGRDGDTIVFYEINPQVVDIARTEFTFLKDTAARIDIRIGDARLVLESEPPQDFDLLVVDAFSGDAVPLHLLTVEALQIYLKHVKPNGALAFNITNGFVDLGPPLARLAKAGGLQGAIMADEPADASDDDDAPFYTSVWVLMSRDPKWLDTPDIDEVTDDLPDPGKVRAWTDDFSNILSAVHPGGSEEYTGD